MYQRSYKLIQDCSLCDTQVIFNICYIVIYLLYILIFILIHVKSKIVIYVLKLLGYKDVFKLKCMFKRFFKIKITKYILSKILF